MAKRIFLFVLTNLAVVVVLGIVASLLGVNRYLTANGLNLAVGLLDLCLDAAIIVLLARRSSSEFFARR